MKSFVTALIAIFALASCSTAKKQVQPNPNVEDKVVTEIEMSQDGRVEALQPNVIYRMNGDYAALVPVNLNEEGTGLVSYPDPIDITPSQKPEPLIDGWYLDHRGVGKNTAFTTWTYEEYHALPKAPSQAEIMAHIKVRGGIAEIRYVGDGDIPIEAINNIIRSQQ